MLLLSRLHDELKYQRYQQIRTDERNDGDLADELSSDGSIDLCECHSSNKLHSTLSNVSFPFWFLKLSKKPSGCWNDQLVALSQYPEVKVIKCNAAVHYHTGLQQY